MTSDSPHFGFLDPPEKEGEIGRLGPYRVTGTLGKGGMGHVFRAEDGRLQRSVALKVMNKKFAATPNSRKRFVEEARSMAAVHHDNVATIFEVGIHSGTPFMAMEMLKGKTLAEVLAQGVRFHTDEILRLAGEVALGLAAAHACGIIHRDVKPANIWIEEPSGRAKILDFGLALAGVGVGFGIDTLSRGTVVGTPGYLAPEQARGEPLDDRTDIYSLGVVLYQMCTEKLPLISDTISGQLIAIISHEPKPIRSVHPDTPGPLADLIHQCLAKDPHRRPRSAVVLKQQIDEVTRRCRQENESSLQIVTEVPTAQPKKSSTGTPASGTPASGTPIGTPASSRRHRESSSTTKVAWLKSNPWVLSAALLIAVVVTVAAWRFTRQEGRVASTPSATNQTDSRSAKTAPKTVSPKSLRPLELTPISAGSARVASGEAARFRMRIVNHAADASVDPGRIHSQAKVAAQVATYLKNERGLKRKAPLFPKKFSPRQLPSPGESKPVEIQFITSGLVPGKFEVIFELQSPGGATIGTTSTQLVVTENLGEGDLLGFEILRTHAGGGDTYVRNNSSDDFGSNKIARIHHVGSGKKAVTEHVYLQFDLSKSPVPKDEIDAAVLLLTLDKGSHQSTSTILAFGVSEGLPQDTLESRSRAGSVGTTSESPPAKEHQPPHLTWDRAPSRAGIESLSYLAQVTIDNGGDTLKGVVDGVRIHGANLDDFLRMAASDLVTIVLIRENKAEKPTCFSTKEGKPNQSPALAIRPLR